MKTRIVVRIGAGFIFGAALAAVGQNATPSSSAQATPSQAHPARVRVKLDGFDLAAGAKHTSANQIGGASRGIGAVTLFAPNKGLAYSLHPTLQWSGSPDTKYKLEIEDLAAHTTFNVTVEGTSFTYPETAAPLKPSNTYSWKVAPEVELMGGSSDSVLMVIVGGAEREQIAAALAAITQTAEGGDRARAQVYYDNRIWYDAVQAYSILIASHPQDAELHRMRGNIYDQVEVTQKLANQDFAAAK